MRFWSCQHCKKILFFVDFLKGCLFVFFCFVPVRSTELGCFRLHSCLFGKLLRRRGASAWCHGIWTCSAKVFEYWVIFSLKIKLNCSWKFRRNWNVPLVGLERSWWAGFNGIYLVRCGFRMWEILILKWCLDLKIQINSQKTRFTVQFKHDFLSYLAVQKMDIDIAKQFSHVEFPYL